MSRAASFLAGLKEGGHRVADGGSGPPSPPGAPDTGYGNAPPPTPSPSEEQLMQEGFGNSSRPGESFRQHLNQATPQPNAAANVQNITQSVRDNPNFSPAPPPAPLAPVPQNYLPQSEGAPTTGPGTLTGRNGTIPAGGSTTTPMQYDEFGNVVPDSGGTTVGPSHNDGGDSWLGRIGNFAHAAAQNIPGFTFAENTATNLAENYVETAQESAGAAGRPQATGGLGVTQRIENAMSGYGDEAVEGGRWLRDATGWVDTYNTARSVINDPRGAASNVWNAADTAVTNPTQVVRGAQRIIPAMVEYYQQHPGELAKLGVGAGISVATGMGTSAVTNAATNAATNWVRGTAAAQRAVRAVDAVTDAARITRPLRNVADAVQDAEYVSRPVRNVVDNAELPDLPQVTRPLRNVVDNAEVPDLPQVTRPVRNVVDNAEMPELPQVNRPLRNVVDNAELPSTPQVTRPLRQVADSAELPAAPPVTRPLRDLTDNVAADVAQAIPKPRNGPLYQATQAADRSIDFVDNVLNKAIGVKEEVRDWTHNLPRRALGMDQKDLRIGPVARFQERLGNRIEGDVDVNGNPSSSRQLIASRVKPLRQKPELPEGTNRWVRNNIENDWRNNAVRRLNGPGNPIPEINEAISIAENPLGYAMNKFFGSGEGVDEDLSEYNYLTPGQARGFVRTKRQTSTPSPDADTRGFYQSTPTSPPPSGQGLASNPYTGMGGYKPGRGWRAANSSMYRDEQEPMAYG